MTAALLATVFATTLLSALAVSLWSRSMSGRGSVTVDGAIAVALCALSCLCAIVSLGLGASLALSSGYVGPALVLTIAFAAIVIGLARFVFLCICSNVDDRKHAFDIPA